MTDQELDELKSLWKEIDRMKINHAKLNGSISAIYELIKDLQIKVEFLETKLQNIRTMNALLEHQLDFFEPQTEEYFLRKEMEALSNAQNNLRKGLFARYNDLASKHGSLLMKQQEEIEALKRQLMMVAKAVG